VLNVFDSVKTLQFTRSTISSERRCRVINIAITEYERDIISIWCSSTGSPPGLALVPVVTEPRFCRPCAQGRDVRPGSVVLVLTAPRAKLSQEGSRVAA
jgi:hypothetical protein